MIGNVHVFLLIQQTGGIKRIPSCLLVRAITVLDLSISANLLEFTISCARGEKEREICLFASNLFNKSPLKTHTKKTMILRFKIKQTDNNAYISNQRALLSYDAGVGRDKNHLITTPSLFKSIITNNLIN